MTTPARLGRTVRTVRKEGVVIGVAGGAIDRLGCAGSAAISSDTVLALWTCRPGLAVVNALALSIAITARNLWLEISDVHGS